MTNFNVVVRVSQAGMATIARLVIRHYYATPTAHVTMISMVNVNVLVDIMESTANYVILHIYVTATETAPTPQCLKTTLANVLNSGKDPTAPTVSILSPLSHTLIFRHHSQFPTHLCHENHQSFCYFQLDCSVFDWNAWDFIWRKNIFSSKSSGHVFCRSVFDLFSIFCHYFG